MKDVAKGLNGIKINLTSEDIKEIRNLLKDLKFCKSYIETIFAIINVGKGRIYFETSHEELATEIYGKQISTKAKNRKKNDYRKRKIRLLRRQEKVGKIIVNIDNPLPDGREGKMNQYKPFVVKIELIILEKLVNLNNECLPSSELKYKKLRKIYGLK